MTTVSLPGPIAKRRCSRLVGIEWKTYTRLLHAFSEQPGYRLIYDRGVLEIMSPSLEHDEAGRFLCLLVQVLTEELGLPFKAGGGVTLRRQFLRRGIEADECFWIANAPRMAGVRQLNLRTDPPPDLAIEVDVSRRSLNRLGIYAALRVQEVWRLDGATLMFHALVARGTYLAVPTSLSFALVTPADVLGFVQLARQASDTNVVIRQFRAWVRQRQAGQNPPPNARGSPLVP
jgi:Uma2 family endonuclease